ncbi:hypothetical protein SV7mr_28670 [Stieleria bergensis]|uniref:Uncharacterized protein n=1 Tax=Stieleria bergensis TaxID=2528025 RepID=A0A517SW32_9BACT|nr:hypothetical protein SV7mr_28670 [Planctomycetes bacterium SV_7m_r]
MAWAKSQARCFRGAKGDTYLCTLPDKIQNYAFDSLRCRKEWSRRAYL